MKPHKAPYPSAFLVELRIWRYNYKEGMPVLTMLDREIEVEARNDRNARANELRRIRRAMMDHIDNSDR